MRCLKLIFIVLYLVSASLKVCSQTTVSGCVVDEYNEPFRSYTLKVLSMSKPDSLQLYSPDGCFSFEGEESSYRFTIAYFGEQVLDTIVGKSDLSQRLVLRAKTTKALEEVLVSAKRPIVKSKLMEDEIQVKEVAFFRNNDAVEVLEKIPGVIKNNGQLNYKSLPVIYVRFGQQGIRRPLTADMQQMLESFYAEDISTITFKRLPQGNQYELIVNPVAIKGFETTASLQYSRGEGNYWNANARSILNTKKMANSLYLRTRPYSFPSSSTRQYAFDDGIRKNIESASQSDMRNFYIDYANSYSLSKEASAGLLINYFTDNSNDNRTSNVFGNISSMNAFQLNRFLTLGVYFDLIRDRHSLHLEAVLNKKGEIYKTETPQKKPIQSTKSNSSTPNVSADYTYSFGNPKFKLRSLSAYSCLLLTAEDVLNNERAEDFREDVFKQDIYLSGSWGKTEFNLGMTFDYSKSNKAEFFYADPHFLLGHQFDGHKFTLRYDQTTSRPLSYMLVNTTKQVNDGVAITGNNELKPDRYRELALSYRKGNFGMSIGGYKRSGWQILLPVYKDDTFLYKYTNLGESYMFDVNAYYSQYWKYFYISPNISFQAGRFKLYDSDTRYGNKYLFVSLPFGVNYKQHKVSFRYTYSPIVQFENTKDEERSNLSFEYTLTALNNALRISLFVNDVFDQDQRRFTRYANGFEEYNSSTNDSRSVGLQLVYRFSYGSKVKSFSTLKHNTTRN